MTESAPTEASARARRHVLAAEHADNHETVHHGLTHSHPAVRATAVAALARLNRLDDEVVASAMADTDFRVRRELARLGATHDAVAIDVLLDDDDGRVVEMAAWAFGEREVASPTAFARLCAIATDHDDALCREAAVAALGAIGDDAALPTILSGLSDRATVRRRAAIALAPFTGPEVEQALTRALDDRDWQVRQAAEDLLAIDPESEPEPEPD